MIKIMIMIKIMVMIIMIDHDKPNMEGFDDS